MRTPIYFLALLLLTAPVFGNTSNIPALREESEVNDIPFNTELIFLNHILSAYSLREEPYVDDIPFNTEKIAYQAMLDNVTKNHEESYVADIPFSTEMVASNYKADHAFVNYYEELPVCDFSMITVCYKDCTKRFSYPFFTRKISKVKILDANSLQIENLELKYPAYLELVRPSAKDVDIISTAE
jgi:hypothetical protein